MNELKLTAIFEKAEEGGYIGYVAELPGANTQGETIEETRGNLKEAVSLLLECYRDEAETRMSRSRDSRKEDLILQDAQMKLKDLLRHLDEHDCRFFRQGGNIHSGNMSSSCLVIATLKKISRKRSVTTLAQRVPRTRMIDLDQILLANPRMVARAITLVENGGEGAAALMKNVFPRTGKAQVIGITGSPGAGKSSLVDKLAFFYKEQGERIGIICIDPSSPFSGGAILGDRIRMATLGLDKNIFIRSMATRGNLGGLARATVDAVAILDAAGFEKVIVETVGVGQDEVEIVKTADVSVVVLVPGMGDDIQAIKAGIMEIGDVFVINKADREGVLRTQKELESLLSLAHRPDMWNPPIVKTIATESKGIQDLAAAIETYYAFQANGTGSKVRRHAIARWRLLELLRERLLSDLLSRNGTEEKLEKLAIEIADKRNDPYSAVETLVQSSSFSLSADEKRDKLEVEL